MSDNDELARLRKAITDYLAGDYDRPLGERYRRKDGLPSKNDTCIHKLYMWEPCENCIDAHFAAALTHKGPDNE